MSSKAPTIIYTKLQPRYSDDNDPPFGGFYEKCASNYDTILCPDNQWYYSSPNCPFSGRSVYCGPPNPDICAYSVGNYKGNPKYLYRGQTLKNGEKQPENFRSYAAANPPHSGTAGESRLVECSYSASDFTTEAKLKDFILKSQIKTSNPDGYNILMNYFCSTPTNRTSQVCLVDYCNVDAASDPTAKANCDRIADKYCSISFLTEKDFTIPPLGKTSVVYIQQNASALSIGVGSKVKIAGFEFDVSAVTEDTITITNNINSGLPVGQLVLANTPVNDYYCGCLRAFYPGLSPSLSAQVAACISLDCNATVAYQTQKVIENKNTICKGSTICVAYLNFLAGNNIIGDPEIIQNCGGKADDDDGKENPADPADPADPAEWLVFLTEWWIPLVCAGVILFLFLLFLSVYISKR